MTASSHPPSHHRCTTRSLQSQLIAPSCAIILTPSIFLFLLPTIGSFNVMLNSTYKAQQCFLVALYASSSFPFSLRSLLTPREAEQSPSRPAAPSLFVAGPSPLRLLLHLHLLLSSLSTSLRLDISCRIAVHSYASRRTCRRTSGLADWRRHQGCRNSSGSSSRETFSRSWRYCTRTHVQAGPKPGRTPREETLLD